MTKHRHAAKPKRWSKGRVRALAWVTGAATFVAGFGIFGALPKPPAANATGPSHRHKPPRQRIIVHKVTRRVVVVDPVVTAPVTYVPTTSSGVGSFSGSTSSSGGTTAVPPPPPPPPPTSGS